jgi:hypothetical protein
VWVEVLGTNSTTTLLLLSVWSVLMLACVDISLILQRCSSEQLFSGSSWEVWIFWIGLISTASWALFLYFYLICNAKNRGKEWVVCDVMKWGWRAWWGEKRQWGKLSTGMFEISANYFWVYNYTEVMFSVLLKPDHYGYYTGNVFIFETKWSIHGQLGAVAHIYVWRLFESRSSKPAWTT